MNCPEHAGERIMSVMSKYLAHYAMGVFLCAMVVATPMACAQTRESQDDDVVSIEAFAAEEATDIELSSDDADEPKATSDSQDESDSVEYVDLGDPISVENLGIAGDESEAETSPPRDLPEWARFEPTTPRLVKSGEGDSGAAFDAQDARPAASPEDQTFPDESQDDANRSRLLNASDSRDVPVTGADNEGASRVPLPKDGAFIQDRKCRLYRHPESNWLILRFIPDDQGRAPADCWVLPSRLLEEMEKTASVQPDAIFRVSGESKVYQKRAFIHLGKVGVESDFDPLEDAVHEGDVETASEDDPDREEVRTIEEGSSDDVLEVLLTERPAMPVVKPRESAPEDREQPGGVSPEIADQDVTHPGRGQSVVDRTVIFLPSEEGNWTEVVFESDNHGQEPPLRALPCAALSKAERVNTDRPHDSVRFRVSGEITEYKGKRYLLIRKAIERRDMDEF